MTPTRARCGVDGTVDYYDGGFENEALPRAAEPVPTCPSLPARWLLAAVGARRILVSRSRGGAIMAGNDNVPTCPTSNGWGHRAATCRGPAAYRIRSGDCSSAITIALVGPQCECYPSRDECHCRELITGTRAPPTCPARPATRRSGPGNPGRSHCQAGSASAKCSVAPNPQVDEGLHRSGEPPPNSQSRVALHEPLTVTPYALAEHEKVPSTDPPVSEAENVPLASPSHSPETVRLAAPAASTNPDSDVMAPVAVPVMVPSETVRVTDPASVPYG